MYNKAPVLLKEPKYRGFSYFTLWENNCPRRLWRDFSFLLRSAVVLEVLDASLGVSLRGREIHGSVGSRATVEPVGPEPPRHRVVSATALQRIVGTTTAGHIVASLGVDIVITTRTNDYINTGGASELALVKLAVLRPTDDATLVIDVDGRCLPIAHGGRRRAGRCASRCGRWCVG